MEIYLDNAATTKPNTIDAVNRHMEYSWYNPSSAYSPAERVFDEIKNTRELVKKATGFEGKCFFTSGGTEANNTVIISSARNGAHFITDAAEHSSVYESMKHLEELGCEVDYIKPRGFIVYAQDVAEKVRDNTVLVSVMHVNNETGAINDIDSICEAVKQRNPNTLFHSDGVQALFKLQIRVSSQIDFYTVSAHKINALKGMGALLAREGRHIKKLHYGGEQELFIRPGTENTIGIQSFHEALSKGIDSYSKNIEYVSKLEQRLLKQLSGLEDARLNLPPEKVPHIINVSFPGVRAEVLVRLLGEKGIYIGTGAACSRGKLSRVLLECGVERKNAEGAVRISMSAENTEADIDICVQELEIAVKQLRRIGGR